MQEHCKPFNNIKISITKLKIIPIPIMKKYSYIIIVTIISDTLKQREIKKM